MDKMRTQEADNFITEAQTAAYLNMFQYKLQLFERDFARINYYFVSKVMTVTCCACVHIFAKV